MCNEEIECIEDNNDGALETGQLANERGQIGGWRSKIDLIWACFGSVATFAFIVRNVESNTSLMRELIGDFPHG